MDDTTLRYKTYKALLEVDLTTTQRQRLIEAGIIDKVLDFFGAGKDALTKYGGGLKKMFSDSKYARRSATAKKNIEKELKDLKSVAKDAGQDESVVYQILNMILADAGVDPKVVGNPPTADGSGGGQSTASTGLPSGTPIKLDSKNATTTFAKINADVTGEDPKKAADDATSQKMTPEKMSVLTMKNIAKQTGVKFNAVDAVFKALIDSGHLVAEGRLPLTRSSLLRMCKEVHVLEEQRLVTERWQHLAGFGARTSGYLFEAPVDQLLAQVKNKKDGITSVADLVSLVKGKYDALGDAEKQEVINKLAGDNSLNKKLGKKPDALKQELAGALSSSGGSSAEKEDPTKIVVQKLADMFTDDPGLEKGDVMSALSDKMMAKFKLGKLSDEQKDVVANEVLKQVAAKGKSPSKSAAGGESGSKGKDITDDKGKDTASSDKKLAEMKCPHCGEKANPDKRFCGKCGKALLECKNCGKPVAPNKKFCGYCGESLKKEGAKAGGKEQKAGSETDKATAAKKKYAAAFDDVKKKVADKADDDSIGKVLTYLDDLESVEIK